MALSDVRAFTADANTLCLLKMQESAAGTTWDNNEGDANWDATPASGNEPQISSTSLPNANFTYAKIFDNNDYATTADPAEFPTGDMTVEFLIYIGADDPADTECIIGRYPTTAGQRNFYIHRDSGAAKNKLTFGISDDGTTFDTVQTTNALGASAWHYVACVYDASTSLKIYVDGAEAGSNTTGIDASIQDSNATMCYGRYNASWGDVNALEGRLVDVRFSNKNRTQTEIEAHWAGTDGGTPPATAVTPPPQVIFWGVVGLLLHGGWVFAQRMVERATSTIALIFHSKQVTNPRYKSV